MKRIFPILLTVFIIWPAFILIAICLLPYLLMTDNDEMVDL